MRSRGFAIWILGLALLVTAACTASRPPTPTPPPASAGGAAEATQRPTHTATLPPTATPTPTETPTPNFTATAQAEREQAEKQLWQEIEQLQQFFKEGYSYTLEEPYQIQRDVSTSLETVIAGLVTQEFQFVRIGDKSLWDWLNEIGRLAEQAGYRLELHVDGTIYLHHDGGTKHPIHLENWKLVYQRGRLNYRSWPVEGPGVRIIEGGYIRVGTTSFLVDPPGRSKGNILKTTGEGKHEFRLSVNLKPIDISADNNTNIAHNQEIFLGDVYFYYKADYKQDNSKGYVEKLRLLQGTRAELSIP